MSKKSEILRLWQECFPEDSPKWLRMFFDATYSDEEALSLADPDTGATASSLLLLPYSMQFNAASIGVGYIYGAGTLRRFRARGYMSQLMRLALHEAADRGDSLAVLIPASESLRLYYQRFGFATVFYATPMRYTAAHHFSYEGEYDYLSTLPPSQLFEAYERLSQPRNYNIRHTAAQFLTIMEDCRLSGHIFAAIGREEVVEAMAWARFSEISNDLIVTEVLADSDNSQAAVMAALQTQAPHRPMTLLAQPSDQSIGGNLTAQGMARVVNPEVIFTALAEAHPTLRLSIKLTDPILPENTGIYTLANGKLTVADITAQTTAKVQLDITPDVLTALLFSASPMRDITGLPCHRPHLALMLN